MVESFGTVRYSGGKYWLIRCEPHVRARFKRVFARVRQEAGDEIALSTTPENSRELEWFLQRYPMTISETDKRILRRRANEHRKQEEQVAKLLSGHVRPAEVQLAEPARQYQLESDALLEVKGGLLLGDDVGLGKTVSAICGMARSANLPALVVCPTNLPGQWKAQINRFLPSLRVHIIRNGEVYDPGMGLLDGGVPDVLIINYHKLRKWADHLAGHVKYVVFDEGQELRRAESDKYSAAKHVARRARRVQILTATPIYNYGIEFWNVIDIALPGALGEKQEFVREWCTGRGGDKSAITDTERFGAYLRREGIMVRRTRKEVGRELPELTQSIVDVESDPKVLERLTGDAIELARIVVRSNERFRGEKMEAAGRFESIMRQATGIAKAPFVAEFVRLLLASEDRVVMFGWHREVYSIWLERLKDFRPVLYTGTESPRQKQQSVDAFLNGGSRVMMLSLRSAVGLDGLQGHCKVGVIGELDWSPGVYEQCIGRYHRDGQDSACMAFFMVADDGCDPIMLDVAGMKREQKEGVMNPGRPLLQRVDSGESIRRLAREFLDKQGRSVSEAA